MLENQLDCSVKEENVRLWTFITITYHRSLSTKGSRVACTLWIDFKGWLDCESEKYFTHWSHDDVQVVQAMRGEIHYRCKQSVTLFHTKCSNAMPSSFSCSHTSFTLAGLQKIRYEIFSLYNIHQLMIGAYAHIITSAHDSQYLTKERKVFIETTTERRSHLRNYDR